MKNHFERRPENRELPADHAPAMPEGLPTEDTANPRSTPLRREQEHETPFDPDLPPEPNHDPAP
jgi:hypothetical protein